MINRNFDPFLDAWVDYRVYGYVFKDSGRVVGGYTLDNFDTRRERNYDQFGNEILYASSRWSIEDNDWRTWLKITSRYSDHNKQLEQSFYFWLADTLGLIQVNQTDYEYVDDTLLNSMTRYDYDDDSAVEVPEFNQETEFRIYPNPVTGLLNITLPRQEHQDGDTGLISIYNLDGRQVMSIVSGATNQVDVSHLESGVYILSVSTHDRSYFGKFMKK